MCLFSIDTHLPKSESSGVHLYAPNQGLCDGSKNVNEAKSIKLFMRADALQILSKWSS